MSQFFTFLILFFSSTLAAQQMVEVGSEVLLSDRYSHILKNKHVGLITNHTAVNRYMQTTVDLLRVHSSQLGFTMVALFAPEHGIRGAAHADDKIHDTTDYDGLPIYSLHGKTDRPTPKMLKGIDTLIFDIQDLGARSYTYCTTLFHAMESAAKHGITVIVLDRPNPINGVTVDGPMLEEKWRSKVGYINVPYCHGMTIGELARFFNEEYKIGCKLVVVPMRGWKRDMSFTETGLPWVPTSPHIPEATTALYYPATGILGELRLVNIGVGYTLPFKVVGAPWIDARDFAKHLNEQKFPGVFFQPFYYRPFYGKFAHKECQGVLIVITNPKTFKPVSTQYLIIGILKSLYPTHFKDAVAAAQSCKNMFCKVNGTEQVYDIITKSKFIVWKLQSVHENERKQFLTKRKKYLIPSYSY